MSELNKHILLVMKWLGDKGSVSQDELIENRKAAYAAAAYAAADDAAYAAAYAAAAAEKWVDKYFERTGENKQDYIDAIEAGKVSSKKEPTQEWVDGLPPVGCECDATWLELPDGGGNDFCRVMIKGFYGDEVWFSKVHGVDGYSEVVKITNCVFRPLKSQEQKDREAFNMAVIDSCMGIHKEDFNIDEIAGVLYHAGFKAPEGD